MSFKIAIHQPENFVYIPFLAKLDQADIFVILDDVQFQKNGFENRNRIKTSTGWQWLTVPIKKPLTQKINTIRIDNSKSWKKDNLLSIKTNYSKALHYNKYIQYFERLYSKPWELLCEFNIDIIKFFIKEFGIKTKIVRSSEFVTSGAKTEKLINICKKLKADTYLSGIGAKDYLQEELFEQNGIKLEYINFKHPVYKQLYGEFMPNMSALDLLMNCGGKSKKLLRGE